jgi:hypothetical protein
MTKSAYILAAVAFIGVTILNVAVYGVIGVFAGVFYLAGLYATYYLGTHLRRSPTPETMRRLQTLSFHTRKPPVEAARAIAAFARLGGIVSGR